MIHGHGFGHELRCEHGHCTCQAWRRDSKANIEARGDTLRVRVYAGPNPMTGRTVSVRGTDDAARRMAQQTLNRLVPKRTRAGGRPVISLGHVIDEWLRVAEHDDSTREAYIERTIKPACRLRSSTTSSWTASAASTRTFPVHEAAERREGRPTGSH
jgi:integrase